MARHATPKPERPRPVIDPVLLAQVLPETVRAEWRQGATPVDRAQWIRDRVTQAPAGQRTVWADVLWQALALTPDEVVPISRPVGSREREMIDSISAQQFRHQRMTIMGTLLATVPWEANRLARAIREAGTPTSEREWNLFGAALDAALNTAPTPGAATAVGGVLADVLTRTGASRLPLKVREGVRASLEYRRHRLAIKVDLTAALAQRANQQPVWQGTAPLTSEEARDLAALYTVAGHKMQEAEALALAARCALTSSYADVLAREVWRAGSDRTWGIAHRLLAVNRATVPRLAAYIALFPLISHGSPWLDITWVRAMAAALSALPTPPTGEIAEQMGDTLLPALCAEGFWVCDPSEGYDILTRWSDLFPASWTSDDGAEALRGWVRRLLDRAALPTALPSALLQALLQHPNAELRHLVLVGILPIAPAPIPPVPTTVRAAHPRPSRPGP